MFEIREDDLMGPEVAALIATHSRFSATVCPTESNHSIDLDALKAPEVTVWTAWDGATIVGCGALKALGAGHGEVKSMHTVPTHRGHGVASAVLTTIIDEASRRNYTLLCLETGANDHFRSARTLYRRYGFLLTEPFGEYVLDPESVFMALALGPAR